MCGRDCALQASEQLQHSMSFNFRKATSSSIGHTAGRSSRRLPPGTSFLLRSKATARALAALEPPRIPASPGRKETMERDVEDAILALRRRLSWIDSQAPPPLFHAERANFTDFAKVSRPCMHAGRPAIRHAERASSTPLAWC